MGLLVGVWLSVTIFLLGIPRDPCADIIGGRESRPHSRPFMAIIQGKIICGGTLIKPNWVLTAAHCDVDRNSKVILGAHSLSKNEPSKQFFKVAKKIPHPCFSHETHDNDLMLLQLNKRVKINSKVSTIKLGQSSPDLKAGTDCLVAGWGTTSNKKEKATDTLHEVNVTIIERSICNDKQHYNSQPVVTMNMVCAGSNKGGKDACRGDSGGPLICNGEQKAIVSWGKKSKCGEHQFPGVYTRLTKNFIDWIMKNTGGDL